ncbi:SidA/IucD/PvdA family monooxygenase (plasmid) [Phyllobacterium sp. 628]|uniref:FAD/NAD(P)-binding protein n=1 Tax=Phyllobacterium sp. 628 TaxID=2718938 RepID=UPI0016627077|nr:FAD/NAD(P)-binding protein [Phyllobacterium sp. 628]QND55074.1 SidA/IucD/PvdA family monooxygenase [Phyllobacterium sp. 628]
MTRRPVVTIIGGGFSGTAIAYHLARQTSHNNLDIIVIEPREKLGGGLAYSSVDPAHRINVPAAKMTMISAEPDHFSRWLAHDIASAEDSLARTVKGDEFPQRSVFGRYVHDHVEPFLKTGQIQHIRAKALGLTPADGRYAIVLGDGNIISADIIALATTHPLPSVPVALQYLMGEERFVLDPYAENALATIEPHHSVLVVGTGLTAADIIASLDRRGHRGLITALSRHGYRSRGHAAVPSDAYGTFGNDVTARSLLHNIRQTLKQATNNGLSWHPVLDALRDQAPSIWSALSARERQRLIRHLRSLWDVHRFRIAPQIEAVLDQRSREGTLAIIAASLQSAALNEGFKVSYRHRCSSNIETGHFDAIVITTGPAHTAIAKNNPLIGSLFEQGLLSADPVGLGLHTARTGQAVGIKGAITETLYIGGPLARGTFGELMGVPEVTGYAEFIAQAIKNQIAANTQVPKRQAS